MENFLCAYGNDYQWPYDLHAHCVSGLSVLFNTCCHPPRVRPKYSHLMIKEAQTGIECRAGTVQSLLALQLQKGRLWRMSNSQFRVWLMVRAQAELSLPPAMCLFIRHSHALLGSQAFAQKEQTVSSHDCSREMPITGLPAHRPLPGPSSPFMATSCSSPVPRHSWPPRRLSVRE